MNVRKTLLHSTVSAAAVSFQLPKQQSFREPTLRELEAFAAQRQSKIERIVAARKKRIRKAAKRALARG